MMKFVFQVFLVFLLEGPAFHPSYKTWWFITPVNTHCAEFSQVHASDVFSNINWIISKQD